ncbi:MAG: hypothetical protein RLZZ453_811 [Chlamydiota bacterium]|jgi:cell shape-determining protein MreC
MRRISYTPYFFLILSFFILLSFPVKVTERIRAFATSSIAPCWQGVDKVRQMFASSSSVSTREKEELRQEIILLRSQLDNVKQWLAQEDRIKQEWQRYQQLSPSFSQSDFFKRRVNEIKEILRLTSLAVPAQISFREPALFGSSLWINVGEKQNVRLGKKVIAKNSPVILGSCVVGIVEFVGDTQSRVRLITDSCFSISVRAVRGGEQNRYLFEHVKALLQALQTRNDLGAFEEKNSLISSLLLLQEKLEIDAPDFYLAKGEVKGSGTALWRSREMTLKGVGFNYDFPDAEGPAHPLQSKHPHLLEKGDLLLTTGWDGLFPAGLKVATVITVDPLKEGAIAYSLQASPLVCDLSHLSYVFVLPPL